MRNIFLLLLLCSATAAFAQTSASSKKLVQRVSTGAVTGFFGSTTFEGSAKPFSLTFNVSPNVLLITPKTYHNVMYGLGSNTLGSLNGYFLPKNFDTYLLYSKSLNTSGQYLGLGIEKMFTAGDLRCFLFTEIGTNLKGTKILSIGFLISSQMKLFQRK